MTGSPRPSNVSLRTPIVVGVDDSPSAVSAAWFAQLLAERTGATCHLVHVVPTGLDPVEARVRVCTALRGAVPSVDPALVHIRQGSVVDELLAYIARVDARMLVLGGKHHTLIGRWVAGSTAVEIVRRCPVPVLVTRGRPERVLRILVGADASPAAFGAIRIGEEWARIWDAAVRVVHAIPLPPYVPEYIGITGFDDLRAQGVAEIERTIAPLIGRQRTETVTDIGEASGVLGDQARYWQADLLVVARHDRGALGRLWVGSVTERLLDGLPTSILVVPATEVEAEERIPVAAVEAPQWHA